MSGERILGNETFTVRFHKPVGNVDAHYRGLYVITQNIVDTIINHELVGFYAAQCELQANIDAFERNMDEVERVERLRKGGAVSNEEADTDQKRFTDDNAKIIGRMQEFYEALAKFIQPETSAAKWQQMDLVAAIQELRNCFETSEAYRKEISKWPTRWWLGKSKDGTVDAPRQQTHDSNNENFKYRSYYPPWYYRISTDIQGWFILEED